MNKIYKIKKINLSFSEYYHSNYSESIFGYNIYLIQSIMNTPMKPKVWHKKVMADKMNNNFKMWFSFKRLIICKMSVVGFGQNKSTIKFINVRPAKRDSLVS